MHLGTSLALGSNLTIGFPSDVAGLADVWDPAQGVTIATGVSNWVSTAGGLHVIAQATGANQPVRNNNVRNGRPGITCNGTSQLLRGAFARALPRTTFLVGKYDNAAAGGMFDGASVNVNRMYRSAVGSLSMGNGGGGAGFAGVDLQNFHIHCYQDISSAAGTLSNYRQEPGGYAKINFDSGVTVCDGLTLGAIGDQSNFGAVTILYVMDYSTAVPDADVPKVMSYLKSLFNL